MTDKVQTVSTALQEARSGLDNLLSNEEMLRKVVEAADLMVASMKQNGKVMSCGNGGSLCDAMHFAEELSGRFRQDRPAYAAMSLADPSHMSCVANDYGYEYVFSRFVEGVGVDHLDVQFLHTVGKTTGRRNDGHICKFANRSIRFAGESNNFDSFRFCRLSCFDDVLAGAACRNTKRYG